MVVLVLWSERTIVSGSCGSRVTIDAEVTGLDAALVGGQTSSSLVSDGVFVLALVLVWFTQYFPEVSRIFCIFPQLGEGRKKQRRFFAWAKIDVIVLQVCRGICV